MNIEIKNLSQIFGKGKTRVVALNHINLSIKPGDFISVVGPSGSGKSTLLLTIAGLIKPTAGEVMVGNQSIYKLTQIERTKLRFKTFGFVFQLFYLIPYLTALENVQIPLLVLGKSKEVQKEIAVEFLEKVGLSHRMNHKPDELSVGERQRVTLARSLASQPQVILADEPTGNLDSRTSTEILEYLAKFHSEGRTIILVSHNVDVSNYTTRKLELIDGKIYHPKFEMLNVRINQNVR